MKLIIREHINAIVEPVKKIFQISVDPNPSGKINIMTGLSKGDIIVFRGPGEPVRLPVGTAGQVLTADPDSELGVRWADPA